MQFISVEVSALLTSKHITNVTALRSRISGIHGGERDCLRSTFSFVKLESLERLNRFTTVGTQLEYYVHCRTENTVF